MKLNELHHDSVQAVADAIETAPQLWIGNCYAIACAIVEKFGSSKARAVYGHYHGPIANTSIFADKGPITRHGWIQTDDGRVIDPTRWVFEDVKPYLHIVDLNDEYDEAGDQWRQAHNDQRPAPAFDNDHTVEFLLPSDTAGFVCSLLPDCPTTYEQDIKVTLSLGQQFWLANLSLNLLGEHAAPIYQTFINVDQGALIPFDNRIAVFGEE